MGGYTVEADLLDKLDRIIQLLEKIVDEKNNYAELTEKYGKIDKSSKDV